MVSIVQRVHPNQTGKGELNLVVGILILEAKMLNFLIPLYIFKQYIIYNMFIL